MSAVARKECENMKRMIVSATNESPTRIGDTDQDDSLVKDIVTSCKPQDAKHVRFSFNYDDDTLELYAEGHNIDDVDEDDDIDGYAIDKLENWARAIAKKLNEKGELSELADNLISTCNWDWYSGMTLFDGGNTPYTYDGFTLSAEAY